MRMKRESYLARTIRLWGERQHEIDDAATKAAQRKFDNLQQFLPGETLAEGIARINREGKRIAFWMRMRTLGISLAEVLLIFATVEASRWVPVAGLALGMMLAGVAYADGRLGWSRGP
jgi:hypothetical protein